MIVVRQLTGTFVGGNITNAVLNVYMKVKNPRFYGPQLETFDAQSGVVAATVASIATKIVADNARDVFSTLASSACATTGMCAPETAQSFADTAADYLEKTYVNPGKMMPSVFGDTTSISRFGMSGLRGPTPFLPKTIPCPEEGEHSLMSFLSRPQFVANTVSGGSLNFLVNNPCCPQPNNIISASWFSYFSKLARFWRGTMYFHFLICGHPMVEVEFQSLIRYFNPGDPIANTVLTSDTFVSTDTSRTVMSGTRIITVPMPFASVREYIPVDLNGAAAVDSTFFTTGVSFNLKVISSMLDTQPDIPYVIFMSAGPDFSFYDPRSPSSFLITDVPLMIEQVKLSLEGNAQSHAMNCVVSPDPGGMVPLRTLEQVASMWSRFYPQAANDIVFPFPGAQALPVTSFYFGHTDILSHISNMFQCYRGDVAFKFMIDPGPNRTTVGLSYGDAISNQLVPIELGDNAIYPFFLNPGNGSFVTSIGLQPVLETCLTYRGTNTLSYTTYNDAVGQYVANVFPLDQEITTINHNFQFNTLVNKTSDVLFRKIGPNFSLYIERLPLSPNHWLFNGNDAPS